MSELKKTAEYAEEERKEKKEKRINVVKYQMNKATMFIHGLVGINNPPLCTLYDAIYKFNLRKPLNYSTNSCLKSKTSSILVL